MKSKKATRRALLSSALSLVLCFSMLLGTTFAWFTDSASTAVNTIQSGTLKVDMVSEGGKSVKDGTFEKLEFVKATGASANEEFLWEPGCTYLSEGFKVVNKGNLALKYKLVINGIDGDNELLDVIDFWLTTDKSSVTAANSVKVDLNGVFELNPEGKSLIANVTNESKVYYLVGHMDEEAGNEYQDKELKGVGITVYATQVEAEFDSFGSNYDKGAAWDGVVPTDMPETLVVNGETKTVHVKDPAAFAYLSTLSAKWAELYTDGNGTEYGNYAAGAGANYYYSGQWTISLEADIDLSYYPIEPVKIELGENCGYSTFDGNNHVIRNINTTTGLFADGTRASFSNLVLENVKATKGALTGFSGSSIKNVTVKNAAISGTDYAGGLAAKVYASVTECKVVDSSVTATGKEAGGLIGYAEANSAGSTISGNTVKNVTVSANNRAAGLIAQPNVGVEVCNNTIDTVTVTAVDTSSYQPGAVVSNALDPANVHDNTVNNCKVGRQVYGLTLFPDGDNSEIIVNDKEGFLNLSKLFADWTALFTDGNGNTYTNYANGAGVDYYYASRWTVSLEADIDLNNATIDPVTIVFPVSTGAITFDGNNHTIKNAKIVTDVATENGAGLFKLVYNTAMKNLKLDNIHVTGSNVGNSTAGILAGSCNAGVNNITITNSSVTGGKYTGGVVGYGYTDVLDCTLTNVTVKGGYKLGGVIGYICASNGNTGEVIGNTLTNCTVDGIGGGVYAGGKTEYVIGQVVGNYNCNGTCNNNTVTGMASSASVAIGKIEAGKDVVTQ